MNILSHNVLNYQFSLEYYILKNKLPHFVNYAKGEKININFICFISDNQYIITTDYRLITIKKCNKENNISDFRNNFHQLGYLDYLINYENLNISITKAHTNPYDLFAKLDKSNPILGYNFMDKKIRTHISQNDTINFNNHIFSKDLKIDHYYSKIIFNSSNVLSIFGETIFETITFSKHFNEIIYILPNARTIIFNNKTQLINPEIIPNVTKKIVLGANYNHYVKFNNIEELVLPNNYNLPLEPNCLPNLKILACGPNYKFALKSEAFPKLEKLIIKKGNHIDSYIIYNRLPKSVKIIYES